MCVYFFDGCFGSVLRVALICIVCLGSVGVGTETFKCGGDSELWWSLCGARVDEGVSVVSNVLF
jgi:hypothetical protein